MNRDETDYQQPLPEAGRYNDRQRSRHSDGTNIFKTDADRDREGHVAREIELAASCEVHEFAALSPIDYYMTRDGRIVAIGELKVRNNFSYTYDTTFLVVRKWMNLLVLSAGMNVKGIFFVRFKDGLFFIDARMVDASNVIITGGQRKARGVNDIEPIILVPVKDMKRLTKDGENRNATN